MMMLAYSVKKNTVNGPAVYSVLEPNTASDSSSVWRLSSVQLVSARIEISHIMARDHDGKIICKCSCEEGWESKGSINFISLSLAVLGTLLHEGFL